MNAENALIRVSAWVAFLLYVASQMALRTSSARSRRISWSLNALGWAVTILHIGLAFQFRHRWSHAAAYEDTARQVAEFTGWNSGAGVYGNYAFALIWLVDLVLSRSKWGVEGTRPTRGQWIMRGFFLFMFLNAAVIFVRGPTKWLGMAACVALIAAWLLPRPTDQASAL